MSDELILSSPVFNQFRGRDLWPYLRGAAVEYTVATMLEHRGSIQCFEEKVASGRSRYLLCRTPSNFLISISKVSTPLALPRPARYREILGKINERLLFPELKPKIYENLLGYCILTHGKNEKTGEIFCSLGMPFPECNGWIELWSINEFLRMPDLAPEEKIEMSGIIMRKLKKAGENEKQAAGN